nr:hypothetical protein [Tanacetum cinerariifolium]
MYLIEAHHHLNPISVPKRDGPWRIDDCVVVLVFKARGISSRAFQVLRFKLSNSSSLTELVNKHGDITGLASSKSSGGGE